MRVLLLILSVLTPILIWAQARGGEIVGQVLDERQRPVVGARVAVHVLPSRGAKVEPFQASTLTAADGTFGFSVPQGDFRVCTQLPGSELLDRCLWSEKPPLAAVKTGQRTAMRPIVMRRGQAVSVSLEDPRALLREAKSTRPPVGNRGDEVLVGVTALNGMFLPMPVHKRDRTSREHRIFVPRDTPLRISVHSPGLNLADSEGKAIDSSRGHVFNARIANDRSKRRFVFRVTGKRAEGGE